MNGLKTKYWYLLKPMGVLARGLHMLNEKIIWTKIKTTLHTLWTTLHYADLWEEFFFVLIKTTQSKATYSFKAIYNEEKLDGKSFSIWDKQKKIRRPNSSWANTWNKINVCTNILQFHTQNNWIKINVVFFYGRYHNIV